MHIELTDVKKWSNSRWQNVTGEFARRSGFTYKPYHVIINEAVESYLAQFSDGYHEKDQLTIPVLGHYGRSKTIANWRRYAKRSKIIYERLSKEGTFGYIDKGNIQYGDEIGFLITQTDDKELIIYLTHKDNIIGDLNHPKYGSKRDSNLKRIYQVFRDELKSSGAVECLSKYKTHVSGVAAGFPRFIDNKNAVNPNTWPLIAHYESDSDEIKFWINGYRDFSSYVWHDRMLHPLGGRKGKPFALIPAPNHSHGSDERRAVPVYISAIVENSIEWRVIKAAFKCNKCNEHFYLEGFFKSFFNCHDVVTLGFQDGTLELQNDVVNVSCKSARIIKVITRDVDSHTGKNICSIIKYDSEEDQVYITNLQCLRVKLSYKLLHNNSIYDEVASYDSSLPKSYAEFLKQICHVPLLDLQLHNSWISLNKLQFNNDGTVEEIKNYLSIEQNDWDKNKWQESVIVHDSVTHEAYRIWIENIEQTPWVYRVDFRKEEKPFVELKCIDKNENHLLSIMAFAVIKKRQILYWGKKTDKLQFGYNDSLYEFFVSGIDFDEAHFADGYRGEDEHGETIWDVEYSYANNAILSSGLSICSLKPITNGIDSIDFGRFVNSDFHQKFKIIARHYNGSDESWKAITKKWFNNSLRQDVEMAETLKNVLQGIKESNTISIDPIKVSRLTKCLKYDDRQSSSETIYELINHLEKNGFRIILDVEKGQRMLDNTESDVSFFISKEGRIVYGFVDKASSTIYLDPGLLNFETIVHEYTHLWVQALRQHKPLIWSQLIEDLKSERNDVWHHVSRVYKDLFMAEKGTTDLNNLIAEEVFAHIVGRFWSNGFPITTHSYRSYNQHNHIENQYNEIRKRQHTTYNYEKDISPEDRIKYLQETVALDLLSNQPLTNFETIEEWIDEEIKANKLITVNLSHLDKKAFRYIIRLQYNHTIEKFDKNNQTITVRSKNMDLLNRWFANDDEDDQDISFHIDLDDDKDSYLPEVFRTKRQDEKDVIDFSEYKQLTKELFEKLNALGPCSHYIKTDKNGNRGLVFLGKGEQTLYLPLFYLNQDTGLQRAVKPALNALIRTSDDIHFFVMNCDDTDNDIDNISKEIGYNGEYPPVSHNVNLIDFSKTHVLSDDLYLQLLAMGRQMRLTTKRYCHEENKPDIWTVFYGKGNTTLTITDNSKIGHMIYSKNGINYHTVPCDLDDHLVDDISKSIGYGGHTPIPRIIKSEYIDFRKHQVLNKTLYSRLLKQGKHMRLTKENENGKYVMFYGTGLINLYVNEQTKIGALIRPVYKDYGKLIGYKALPCDGNENKDRVDQISELIGYKGEKPAINRNILKEEGFYDERILTTDFYQRLLALGPYMRWTSSDENGPFVVFYQGRSEVLVIPHNARIGSMIIIDNKTHPRWCVYTTRYLAQPYDNNNQRNGE